MEQKDSKSSSQGPHGPDNGTNNTNSENSATNTAAKPVPTEEFLQQVLGFRSQAGLESSTPRYTATVELGAVTTPSTVDTHQSAPKINANDQITGQKRARDTKPDDVTSEPAPKRAKGQSRFLRTEAEELDVPVNRVTPWCRVEVTRVAVTVSLLTLQLPLYRKFFGTSVAPRYDLLNQSQSAALATQACQSLTCTVEWANDTRQRSQDLAWQITPRDSTQSTATVTLALRHTEVLKRGQDWQLQAIFAGFRVRIRAPLRVQLSRASATGSHVLFEATLTDTCWHTSAAPFTLEKREQFSNITKLGKLAEFFYEPHVTHSLTLPADTSVSPPTPQIELSFLRVSQMTELLGADWIAEDESDTRAETEAKDGAQHSTLSDLADML